MIDDQVLNFFDDDSEREFEGFGPENLINVDRNILANLPISDFSPYNDGDFQEDLINGWKREDTDANNAPSLVKLN